MVLLSKSERGERGVLNGKGGEFQEGRGDFLRIEMERVEGIEPSTKAWEAFVLPLNYTRSETRSERLTLYQNPAPI